MHTADAEEPLPPGWQLLRGGDGGSADDVVLFRFAAVPERPTSQDPRFMPRDWQQRLNERGDLIFVYTEPVRCHQSLDSGFFRVSVPRTDTRTHSIHFDSN